MDKQMAELNDIDGNNDMEEIEKLKMRKSRDLVVNLQKMFTAMFMSNLKY
jgi:hypothetical protein